MMRFLIGSVLSILVLYLAVLPFSATAFRHYVYAPKIADANRNIRVFLPKIEEDLRQLAADPIFPPLARTKNAAPFVLQYLPFQDSASTASPPPSSVLLMKLLAQFPNFTTDAAQFEGLLNSPDLEAVDASWIAKLRSFDHLDGSADPSVASRLRGIAALGSLERVGVAAGLPILNTIDLIRFATIHVLQQHRKGATLAALGDLRHVAILLQTETSLVGHMSAAAALGRERYLAEVLKLPEWKAISAERVKRYKRVAWIWPGLVRLTETENFPKQLEPYLESQYGACSVADSIPNGQDSFFDFFEGQAPFETNFRASLERSRALKSLLIRKCGTPEWAVFLKSPASEQRHEGPSGQWTTQERIRYVPYVRRIVGMLILGLGRPDEAKLYKAD